MSIHNLKSQLLLCDTGDLIPEELYDKLFSKLPLKSLWGFQSMSKDMYKVCNKAATAKELDDLGTLSILPPDIIRNIISRIPLKHYVQLGCLNHGWKARVLHRLYSISKKNILIPSNPLHSIDTSKYSFEEHPESTIYNADTNITIVGSLDGSAILMVDTTDTDSHVLFLYNPFTETILQIPVYPIGTHDYIDYMFMGNVYGFGYSHKPCDAIIVVLSSSGGYRGMYSRFFSFTKKSWHRLKCKQTDLQITSQAATFIEKSKKLYCTFPTAILKTFPSV